MILILILFLQGRTIGEWLRDTLNGSGSVVLGASPDDVTGLAELDLSDDGERDLGEPELESVRPMLAGATGGRNGRSALPALVRGQDVDAAMTLGELSVDKTYLSAEIPSSNAVASARGLARVGFCR